MAATTPGAEDGGADDAAAAAAASSSSSSSAGGPPLPLNPDAVTPLSLGHFKRVLQAEADARRLNGADTVLLHFEDPTSSRLSLYLGLSIMGFILLSVRPRPP